MDNAQNVVARDFRDQATLVVEVDVVITMMIIGNC